MAMMMCTACRIMVKRGDEQRDHYRSPWHAYNLKRELAGLGPIDQQLYEEQIHQMEDIKKSQEIASKEKGINHLKYAKTAPKEQSSKEAPVLEIHEYILGNCLFDKTQHETTEELLDYMKSKYGFFIHDTEYLTDMNGLITMLGEKIWLGAQCIYCNRGFTSREACWDHMKSTNHCRIGISTEELQAELDPFFDYRPSYKKFEIELKKKYKAVGPNGVPQLKNKKDQEEDEWENDEEKAEEEEDNIEMFDEESTNVENILSKYGLSPIKYTESGTLKLLDGRELICRDAAFIYKQNVNCLVNKKHSNVVQEQRQKFITANGEKIQTGRNNMTESQIKAEVRRMRYELSERMKVGVKSNKFTRAALQPQKTMM